MSRKINHGKIERWITIQSRILLSVHQLENNSSLKCAQLLLPICKWDKSIIKIKSVNKMSGKFIKISIGPPKNLIDCEISVSSYFFVNNFFQLIIINNYIDDFWATSLWWCFLYASRINSNLYFSKFFHDVNCREILSKPVFWCFSYVSCDGCFHDETFIIASDRYMNYSSKCGVKLNMQLGIPKIFFLFSDFFALLMMRKVCFRD